MIDASIVSRTAAFVKRRLESHEGAFPAFLARESASFFVGKQRYFTLKQLIHPYIPRGYAYLDYLFWGNSN